MWIEICYELGMDQEERSLPTRECGLKCCSVLHIAVSSYVAPHAGVWIEINSPRFEIFFAKVAPHAGVWIEILFNCIIFSTVVVAPHAGVWIEIFVTLLYLEKT